MLSPNCPERVVRWKGGNGTPAWPWLGCDGLCSRYLALDRPRVIDNIFYNNWLDVYINASLGWSAGRFNISDSRAGAYLRMLLAPPRDEFLQILPGIHDVAP